MIKLKRKKFFILHFEYKINLSVDVQEKIGFFKFKKKLKVFIQIFTLTPQSHIINYLHFEDF